MNRLEAEHVVAALLLSGALKEDFLFTPYNTISYVVAGPAAARRPALEEEVWVPADGGGKKTATKKKRAAAEMGQKKEGPKKRQRAKEPPETVCLVSSDSE